MSILPKITGISISEGARQIIDLGYDLDNDNAVVTMAELDLFGGGIGMRAYEDGLLSHQFALNTLGVLVQSGVDAPQSVTWSNLANKVEAVGALSTASNATTLNVNNTIQIQNGETSLPPTSSIVISCDADIPQFLINDSAGSVGQAIVNTVNGISWGDVTTSTPTLQQVIDVIPSGNTITGTPIIMNGSIGATLIDATYSANGISILKTLGSFNVAEYSTAGMYLNLPEQTDNIVINPSIVLNTTESAGPDSGISSIYSCNTIGYNNSFEIKHNTAFGMPILTQTLNENLGSPFNYNKSVQTPTNITLSSSLYAEQQILDLYTGLTTTQIQSSGANLQVVSATDFTGDVNFTFEDSPPHCAIVPENPNDLTNKLYVDTKVIASGGGQQMYFNYSVASTLPYKALGTTIVVAPQQIITTPQLNPLGVPQVIAQFITETTYPNITTLPAGIWTANIYGRVTGGTTGTLYYQMKVYTFTTGSVKTLIGTGIGIQDVDATTDIVLYTVSTTIDTITGLNLTDRIIVEILTNGVGSNPLSNLNTYFQDGTYSFLTTPLISGTNLLGLNNSWTGINTFATTANIGSLVVSTNSLNSNSTSTGINIGGNLTSGTGTIKIGELQTGSSGELWIAPCNGRTGSVRLFDGGSAGGTLYIANGGNQATTVNIGNATNSRCPINIGAGGTASIGSIAIGSTTRQMTINGSSTSTFVGGTAELVVPLTAYPTGSSTQPTFATNAFWVGNAFTYLKANANTWAAIQTFSSQPITTATIPAYPTVDTGLVSSTWVENAFTYLKANVNTWATVQTFSSQPVTTATIPAYPAVDTGLVSSTWIGNAINYLKANANTWAAVQTFTSQPVITTTIPAYPTVDTGLVSSTWVKNAINYVEKGKITSASSPALAITGTLTFVQTYTVIPLVLLTVDMGSGTTIVSCALAGTTLTTFNYILSSLSGVSSLNYYVIVL